MICDVPLTSYKRIQNETKYEHSLKYTHAYNTLSNYEIKQAYITDKTISVVGLGYVGLSNAVVLARHNKVYTRDLLRRD